MDTSELYIRICNKAKEIQKKWKPSTGDSYHIYCDSPYRAGLDVVSLFDDDVQNMNAWLEAKNEEVITTWLPRQDQLQEMIVVDKLPIFGVKKGKEDAILGIMRKDTLDDFKNWLDVEVKADHYFCGRHNSMEQFWLLFVMSKEFSKRWDDTKKDWIKS